jgi:hypothetical protein
MWACTAVEHFSAHFIIKNAFDPMATLSSTADQTGTTSDIQSSVVNVP